MESKNNTSALSQESEPANNLLIGVLYLIVSILVMTSNGVVIFVITRTRALHQPTLWVISHMAFWDFVNGIITLVIPLPSVILNRFAYPEKYIGIAACFTTYLVSLLFFNVATIVIDRLVCLKFPLAYAKITKSRYVFAAIVLHMLALCRMLVVAFPDMDFYYNEVAAMAFNDYGNVFETLFSLGFIAVAFIIIIVCSCLIVHTVKQRRRRIGPGRVTVISRNMIKLSMMTVLSAAVFSISFVPLIIAICWSLSVGRSNIPNWVVQVMMLCIFSNSIWNVLIYAVTYQPFRQSLIHLFCRSYYRTMLRRRHGIGSRVRTKTESSRAAPTSTIETISPGTSINKPFHSDRLQVPNHLFLASSAKPIPSKNTTSL